MGPIRMKLVKCFSIYGEILNISKIGDNIHIRYWQTPFDKYIAGNNFTKKYSGPDPSSSRYNSWEPAGHMNFVVFNCKTQDIKIKDLRNDWYLSRDSTFFSPTNELVCLNDGLYKITSEDPILLYEYTTLDGYFGPWRYLPSFSTKGSFMYRFHEMEWNKILKVYKFPEMLVFQNEYGSFTFSEYNFFFSNGDVFAIQSDDILEVIDIKTKRTLKLKEKNPNIVFSDDNSMLLINHGMFKHDKDIKYFCEYFIVWFTKDWKIEREVIELDNFGWVGEETTLKVLDISYDGALIAFEVSPRSRIIIYDRINKQVISYIPNDHIHRIEHAIFTSDSKYLITGGGSISQIGEVCYWSIFENSKIEYSYKYYLSDIIHSIYTDKDTINFLIEPDKSNKIQHTIIRDHPQNNKLPIEGYLYPQKWIETGPDKSDNDSHNEYNEIPALTVSSVDLTVTESFISKVKHYTKNYDLDSWRIIRRRVLTNGEQILAVYIIENTAENSYSEDDWDEASEDEVMHDYADEYGEDIPRQRFYVKSTDTGIKLFDTEHNKQILYGLDGEYQSLRLLNNGKALFAKDDRIVSVDFMKKNNKRTPVDIDNCKRFYSFLRTGDYVVLVSNKDLPEEEESTFEIFGFDPDNGTISSKIYSFVTSNYAYPFVRWQSDNILYESERGCLVIRPMEKSQKEIVIKVSNSKVCAATLSNSGKYIAVASLNDKIKIIDKDIGLILEIIDIQIFKVTVLKFITDDQELLIISQKGEESLIIKYSLNLRKESILHLV